MQIYANLYRIAFPALLLLSGCATHAPTISHTHIGHAMTGWADTPNQDGLFIVAEKAAKSAIQAAETAAAPQAGLSSIRTSITNVINDTNRAFLTSGEVTGKRQYGVKDALTETARHIEFAANSPDSSDNIRNLGPQFSGNARFVFDRCDLITALGYEIVNSNSVEEASILSQEILKLVHANLKGNDSNGDGKTGSSPEEYGLKQLRTELQTMIDQEDPPYRTVDSWYLFNLIKLPSGDWIFRKLGGAGSNGQGSGY
ncbi:MAG: hypothetical protein V3W04_00755 [Gammaproteobacteria bacterium]